VSGSVVFLPFTVKKKLVSPNIALLEDLFAGGKHGEPVLPQYPQRITKISSIFLPNGDEIDGLACYTNNRYVLQAYLTNRSSETTRWSRIPTFHRHTHISSEPLKCSWKDARSCFRPPQAREKHVPRISARSIWQDVWWRGECALYWTGHMWERVMREHG